MLHKIEIDDSNAKQDTPAIESGTPEALQQITENKNNVDPHIYRGSIKLTLDEQQIENESKRLRGEWKRAF